MGAASALAERRRILDDVEFNLVRTEAVLRSASYDVDSASDRALALAARPIAPHELQRQIADAFCQPAPEPDLWQRRCYDEWVAKLGAARMKSLLVALLDQFRTLLLLVTADGDGNELDRGAHDVASTGGMLGFPDVTRCCRALLEAPDAVAAKVARAALSDILARSIARLDLHFASAERDVEAA